jgi:predicted permease
MTWWTRLFRRSKLDRELDQEIRSHLIMAAKDRMASGEPAIQAAANARREFGNTLLIQEVTRQKWGFSSLERLGQDLRFALRQLKRNPGFAAIAILSLAFGIGANTAIFSVLNAVLLRSLPIRAPEEIFRVRQESHIEVAQRYSYPVFEKLRDATESVPVAAMSQTAGMNIGIENGAKGERANVQLVSGEFFGVLGVGARLGRVLTEEDNRTLGGDPVAVLSNSYWKERFAGASDVTGRTVTLNGARFTIVGVAEPGFRGVFLEAPTDLWIPTMMQADARYHQNYSANNHAESEKAWIPQEGLAWLDMVLRANTKEKAQALAGLNAAYQQRLTAEAEHIGDPHQRKLFLDQRLVLQSFQQGQSRLRDRFTPLLFALMGMVAIVLFIACANTANLLLARSSARQGEIAVRLSIGAGRVRLIQQLLTESFVLVTIAALTGLVLAHFSADALVRMVVRSITGQGLSMISLDPGVLAFTAAVSVLAGLLFGLAPAFRATKVDLGAALKTAARSVPGRARWNGAKLLVAAQVALSLLLVMGAGLFARSLYNLSRVNLGFDQDRILTVRIDPRTSGISEQQLTAFHTKVLERVESVHGVTSAAMAECGLASGCHSASDGIHIEGYEPSPGEEIRFQENRVSAKYLPTVGMRFVDGRNFDERDRTDTPKVAVVNEALAGRYFAGREAVGKRFGYDKPDTEIIGVVADAHVNSAREPVVPMAFYPLEQVMVFPYSLEVRIGAEPRQAIAAVRAAIAEVAPNLAVERITPLAQQVETTTSPDRIVALLASGFGCLALGLACVGLYGVMSYAVARRTSEIGVRMALGARPGSILGGILRESLTLVCVGLLAGVPLATAGARLLASGLFGVESGDLSTLMAAVFVLTSVVCLAALIPAWRASRVSPMVALRQE